MISLWYSPVCERIDGTALGQLKTSGLSGCDTTDRPLRPASWTARVLLAQALDHHRLGPARWVQPDRSSKPRLSPGRAEFSISHCANAVYLLLSTRGPVGLDAERPGRSRAPMAIADQFFHPAERERLDPDAPEPLFTRLWTLKESHLKYLGRSVFAMADCPQFQPSNTPITTGSPLYHRSLEHAGTVLALCTESPPQDARVTLNALDLASGRIAVSQLRSQCWSAQPVH